MLPSAAVAAAVAALSKAELRDLICTPDSQLYNERISSYWSLTAQKKPHCIVHPKTTEDVVKIVKTLANIPDCPFAVRSGGHIAWGASNTDGGVLIDLGLHMHGAAVHKGKGVVSLLPGTKWSEAYKVVETHGIAIAGGRTASVGVSGLLTGGGISWYIPRVGFCCDQIVNMEIVLADGRVVNANENENRDLWTALKGSSAGNFGIVTRFDVKILPWDGLWGGMLVSEASKDRTTDHVAAMKNFTDNAERFPDSSYIVLWNYEPTMFKDIVVTSFAANTKGQENPAELKQLLEIPTIIKDMKQTTLSEFAQSMEQPYGYHNFWFTTTFINDERIMKKAVEVHAVAVDKIKAVSKTGHFSSLCLFQSLPSYYFKLGEQYGGNSMGLKQHLKGRNAISLLLSINISEEEIRDYGYEVAKDYLKQVDDYAKSVSGYIDWAYVNYADQSQNPMGSLLDPANLKRVALKYDPNGMFQKRTPGFKISKYGSPIRWKGWC
ncbi:FAD linked oxidase [Xylogone sp. PMI_703]|nr:FAD linked oxidase [Xylogone sp. PMI_703]